MRYILALSAFLIATPAFATCNADVAAKLAKLAGQYSGGDDAVAGEVFMKAWAMLGCGPDVSTPVAPPAPAGITSCGWVYGNWVCQQF
jgi:hypothetical protein